MEKKSQDIVIVFDDIVKWNEDIDDVEYSKEIFENAQGYQAGASWIAVIKNDGNTVVYPASRIRQIDVIVKE